MLLWAKYTHAGAQAQYNMWKAAKYAEMITNPGNNYILGVSVSRSVCVCRQKTRQSHCSKTPSKYQLVCHSYSSKAVYKVGRALCQLQQACFPNVDKNITITGSLSKCTTLK